MIIKVDITKEDLDLLEEIISDAQSYYECYNFYDHCSVGECDRKAEQAGKAAYIISQFRDELDEQETPCDPDADRLDG